MDTVFIEWEGNPWLDVRCIASGHWTYRVDFNTMTQQVKNTTPFPSIFRWFWPILTPNSCDQNTSTGKLRKLRRTLDGTPC